MTNNTADTYNGNIVFVQSSTGKVYPNYNNNSPYNGNLTVTSPAATAITFGSGNGTATFVRQWRADDQCRRRVRPFRSSPGW